MVTVAVDGSVAVKPSGVSKVAVNVSSPSRAILSFITIKSTHALVDPAANVAVCVPAIKSLPLSAVSRDSVLIEAAVSQEKVYQIQQQR